MGAASDARIRGRSTRGALRGTPRGRRARDGSQARRLRSNNHAFKRPEVARLEHRLVVPHLDGIAGNSSRSASEDVHIRQSAKLVPPPRWLQGNRAFVRCVTTTEEAKYVR